MNGDLSIRVLSVMTLLTVVGSAAPTAAAPTQPKDTTAYEEDFTTYTHKAYATDTRWDTENDQLRLMRNDGPLQWGADTTVDHRDHTIVVWSDPRAGEHDIYAQKVDSRGNRLWGSDVLVNADEGTVTRFNPAVTSNDQGDVFITWQDYRNSDYDIYMQGLDTAGNRLWASDVRVNSDEGTETQADPAVASSEDGAILVVWYSYATGVCAQRVDEDGHKLWEHDKSIGSGGRPDLAVDGDGNMLVVWTQHSNVYAEKIGPDADSLWDSPVQVNHESGSASFPTIAVGSSDNSTVIGWVARRDDKENIYAQRLGGDGSRLWDEDIQVNVNDGTADIYDPPDLAMNPSGDSYVVWKGDANGSGDIFMQTVAADGSGQWTSDLRVNTDEGISPQFAPSVVTHDDGSVVVAWRDERNGNTDIYTQRISQRTYVWRADVQVNYDNGPARQTTPSVTVDGGANVIIVWEDDRNGDEDIYMQKVDQDGNRLWPVSVRVNSDSGAARQYDPSVACDRNGHVFVTWTDQRGGDDDIYCQQLDESGNKVWSNDLRVNRNINGRQHTPDVAVGGEGNALIVWGDDSSNNIYLQKIGTGRFAVWITDVRVNGINGTAARASPAIAVDRDGCAVLAWRDWREGISDVYVQRIDSDGSRMWPTDTRANAESEVATQLHPDVAIDGGGNTFVTWQDYPQYPHEPSNPHAYAQRLDASGQRLWAEDVLISAAATGSQIDLYPVVKVDEAGNAVIVWQDDRTGYYDLRVYSQRLSEDGFKQWLTAALVSAERGDVNRYYSPAVAVAQTGSAFIAWVDQRANGSADIYAQRMNIVGNRIWLGDLPVVHPDSFYLSTGCTESDTVDNVANDIYQATLTANLQLSGGNVQFYLTNDNGEHWAEVRPGATHVFTTTGSDLRWRAELTADPVWNRTPIVDSLRIEYSTDAPGGDDYEPDDTCAQAQPVQVNGVAQQHTFHQYEDDDWIWFDAQAGTTYLIQTANTGDRADTVLELYDQCGEPPTDSDDNPFGPGASISFVAPSSGTYYVRVRQHDGSIYGPQTDYDLSVRTPQSTGAAIIVAGRLREHDDVQPIINATANLAYQTLLESGFSADDIQYLNADLTQPGVDGMPSEANVRDAVQDWARTRVGLGAPLWLYLADHGNVDRFHNEIDQVVTAGELNLWLSNLEATSGVDQINVVIDACFSGSFIDTHQSGAHGLQEVSGHGRAVVASTTSRYWAYAPRMVPDQPTPLMYFSDGFWHALSDGQSLWSAFLAGRRTVDAGGVGLCGDYEYVCQRPWLDDNGDAWFDDRDGEMSQGRGLAATFAGGTAPYIESVSVGPVSNAQATIEAQVREDGDVERVWARVFAPSFELPQTEDGSVPVVQVPEEDLEPAGGDAFSSSYDGFSEEGVYQVVVYAMDDEGNTGTPKWVLIGEKTVYLPLVLRGSRTQH